MPLTYVRYYYSEFNPGYTCGSVLLHLFHMTCQGNNSVTAKYLIGPENPFEVDGYANNQSTTIVSSTMADLLAQMLRLKRVQKTSADKRDFLLVFKQKNSSASYQKQQVKMSD